MDFRVLGYFAVFCWLHFLFLCSASSPLLTVCPWFWLWGTTFPSSFTMCFRLSQLVQSCLPTGVTGSDLNSSPTGANQWQQDSTPELLTDLLRHRLLYWSGVEWTWNGQGVTIWTWEYTQWKHNEKQFFLRIFETQTKPFLKVDSSTHGLVHTGPTNFLFPYINLSKVICHS